MSRSWTFTDVEFVSLWAKDHGWSKLPEGISFITTTPDYYEFLCELAAVHGRLVKQLRGAFDHVLDVLDRPDLRIIVWCTDVGETGKSVRMHVAMRGEYAYVVTQRPGADGTPGSFVVAECAPSGISDAIVNALPDVGAGHLPEVVLAQPRDGGGGMDYSHGRSPVLDSTAPSVTVNAQRFLAMPVSGVGSIRVVQARSKFGPRGLTKHELTWQDLEGDGRYAIVDHRATAASCSRLKDMIDARIVEVVRVLNDERLR